MLINDTLLEWKETSKLLGYFGEFQGRLQKLMEAALCGNLPEREADAVDFIRQVWGAFPVLGPVPPVKLLQEFEYDRKFYPNYRSHVFHAAGVFLLGLYLYENNLTIRNEIAAYLKKNGRENPDKTFLLVWTGTSLFHDIGYLLENAGAVVGAETEAEICKNLSDIFSCPLSATPCFRNSITSVKEEQIIRDNEIFTKQIKRIRDLEDSNTFSKLSQAGNDSNLNYYSDAEAGNVLEAYYDYAQKTAPKGRKAFRDHGVSSALILDKIWTAYRQELETLMKKHRNVDPHMMKQIETVNSEMEKTEPLMNIILGAIALHNIDKEIWIPDDAIRSGIQLEQFRIYLKEKEPYKALPIAFLLRLCDELQSWDRPRFRAPEKGDVNTGNKEVHISADSSRIYVSYEADKNYVDPAAAKDSAYSKLIKKLKLYLDEDTVAGLMRCKEEKEAEEKPPVIEEKKKDEDSPMGLPEAYRPLALPPANEIIKVDSLEREVEYALLCNSGKKAYRESVISRKTLCLAEGSNAETVTICLLQEGTMDKQGELCLKRGQSRDILVIGSGVVLRVLPCVSINRGQRLEYVGEGSIGLALYEETDIKKKTRPRKIWTVNQCRGITSFAADGKKGFLAVKDEEIFTDYLEEDALYYDAHLNHEKDKNIKVLETWLENGCWFFLKTNGEIISNAKVTDEMYQRKIISDIG